jgi:hypothetical protein
MKAQRRHELQTNELADWLAQVIAQVQPHINKILIGAVAAVLVILGVVYLSGRTGVSSGRAWDEYYKANSMREEEQRINELARVADEYSGTIAGVWARQAAGDARLLRGTNLSYRKRADGHAELEKAKSDFLAVLNEASSYGKLKGDELKLRAKWGLAQTYESLAELDKAIENYEDVAKTWPTSVFGKAAKEHAEYLHGMSGWFEWYAKKDPSTVKPTSRAPIFDPGFEHPKSGASVPDGTAPKDPLDLSPPGDVDFGDLTPKPEDLDPAPPAGDTPDSTPPTDPPATEPPATDPPATDPPPAEPSPDGEQPKAPSPSPSEGEPAPPGEATPPGGN